MRDDVQAPYITEAERDGLPEVPAIRCPVCGAECEEYAFDRRGVLVGCDVCITFDEACDRSSWGDAE